MTEDYDELRLEMFAQRCAELEQENKELKRIIDKINEVLGDECRE